VLLLVLLISADLTSQCFVTGADLSYTTEILRNGGEYFDENGISVDPFEFFADKGTKMVRLRLWHTPDNLRDFCGNAIKSGGLDDVLEAAQRVVTQGMQLKLAIHYSDYFADPGKQFRPEAWNNLSQEVLLDSIENYTLQVLDRLQSQNTLPAIVSIGNETTWGFVDETPTTSGFSWPADADKFNAALSAIDSFNDREGTEVKKALHFTESSAEWAVDLFQQNGIENYDLLGISYYPFFSPEIGLSALGSTIRKLTTDYTRELMVFETGFAWTDGYSDSYNNFIGNNGTVLSYPKSAIGQKDFLMDLAQTIMDNGGTGLIYWEPAWISSDLCDRWGQGSSYENVSLFDVEKQRALPAFDFFDFCDNSSTANAESKGETLQVYPNPIGKATLFIENATLGASWELYNLNGAKVASGIMESADGFILLDRVGISSGTYFFTTQSEKKQRRTRKIVLI